MLSGTTDSFPEFRRRANMTALKIEPSSIPALKGQTAIVTGMQRIFMAYMVFQSN